MSLESFEIEGLALDLFRRAGLDPSHAPSPIEIAHALPALDVEFVLRATRPARLAMVRGIATIRVLASAPALARAWFVAHELGEYALHTQGIEHESVEQFADNIAAALIAPMPAVRTMRDRYDRDLERAATRLRVSQTILALRYGEVWNEPVVLVDRTRVKVRGGEMPLDERSLRRIAAAGRGDGLEAITLTDAPGRVVLVASR